MTFDMIASQLPKVGPSVSSSGPIQFPQTAQFQGYPPTPKQLKYYDHLVLCKEMTDDRRSEFAKNRNTLTRGTIGVAIQYLAGLPYKPWNGNTPPPQNPIYTQRLPVIPPQYRNGMGPTAPKVSDGCYAVVDPVDQVLKFFRVNTPQRGKWKGHTFLRSVSGGNTFPMRDWKERDRIMSEIMKDPIGALKRFGQEIGQCGHCRKQLTDAESRQFGIGPVCRKALGI